MNLEQARELALKKIKESEARSNAIGSTLPGYDESPKLELLILDDLTQTEGFGWMFFYENKKYIETEDINYAVGGNAPIIVTTDGSLQETGTARSIEYYIEEFRKQRS